MSFLLTEISNDKLNVLEYSNSGYLISNNIKKYNKKINIITDIEIEFSKIIEVPRVSFFKQKWIINEYIKQELLNFKEFDYRYHVLIKNNNFLKIFVSIIKKEKIQQLIKQLNEQNIHVESIISGSWIAFLNNIPTKASWGKTLYLSHNQAPFQWVRTLAINNPNLENELLATEKYYQDTLPSGPPTDLGPLAVRYLQENRYPHMNLLPSSFQKENAYRKYKKPIIISSILFSITVLLSSYLIKDKTNNIEDKTQKIKQDRIYLTQKTKLFQLELQKLENKSSIINSINEVINKQNNLRNLFNILESTQPNFLTINKIEKNEDNLSLLISGKIQGNQYRKLQEYIEILKTHLNFESLENLDIQDSKDINYSNFNISLILNKNTLI